jgi:hypothetical protein
VSNIRQKVTLVLASFFFVTGAFPQEQASLVPPPDKDPSVGVWRANRVKSRPKLDKKDASYIRTIKRDGDDLVFSSQIGTSKPSEHNFRVRCDDRFYSVPAGFLSCRYIAPNFVEGETKPKTGEVSYWTREVSADGREMKISGYADRQRTKVKSVEILDRVD